MRNTHKPDYNAIQYNITLYTIQYKDGPKNEQLIFMVSFLYHLNIFIWIQHSFLINKDSAVYPNNSVNEDVLVHSQTCHKGHLH